MAGCVISQYHARCRAFSSPHLAHRVPMGADLSAVSTLVDSLVGSQAVDLSRPCGCAVFGARAARSCRRLKSATAWSSFTACFHLDPAQAAYFDRHYSEFHAREAPPAGARFAPLTSRPGAKSVSTQAIDSLRLCRCAACSGGGV
jgi:hypothetical protein